MAWMRFRCNINCVDDPENCISERLFMEVADTMVRDGWRDLGYTYVSLDGKYAAPSLDHHLGSPTGYHIWVLSQ